MINITLLSALAEEGRSLFYVMNSSLKVLKVKGLISVEKSNGKFYVDITAAGQQYLAEYYEAKTQSVFDCLHQHFSLN